MPDHVKHPERYTAYVLDEPIVVGSGDLGSVDEVPRHTDVSSKSSPIESPIPNKKITPKIRLAAAAKDTVNTTHSQ